MTRKLATIRTIKDLQPIPGADRIELAFVDGWQVIVKKDEFKVGDQAIYFEIDSWVPTAFAPFLSKGKEPRVYHGVPGERLKTMRMKGVLSQGLLLPLGDLASGEWETGANVTDFLGIQLWEKPIPASLVGVLKGNFPPFISKTDQERIQNIDLDKVNHYIYQVTEKLDGSSMTLYHWPEGVYGICSRNVDLKLDQEGNTFVDVGKPILPRIPVGMAFQGELCGPGIQGNQYKLDKHQFFLYNIYNIEDQKYEPPSVVEYLSGKYNVEHVPVIEWRELDVIETAEILDYAKGKSQLNESTREGVVFKSAKGMVSFKVINNDWLLKNE